MNHILKKTAIISFVLLVLGIVCMAVGVGFGGQLNYAFNLRSNKVYVHTDEQMQYVDKTVDVEEFDSLDVELGNVDIEVRQGDHYQVQYHLTSLDEPVVEVKDGKLVIRNEEDDLVTFGWSFGGLGLHIGPASEKERKKMIVIIPEEGKLEDMKVSSEFGDINMADVQTKSFDIKADSGNLTLENMNTGNGTMLAEFGNITVNNLIGETSTITANSGDCSLEALQLNQMSLTAEYGEVELSESEVQELVVEAASGNVSLAQVLTETGDIIAEYGDVSIDTLNGGICTVTVQSGECELKTVQLDNLTVEAEYGNVLMENATIDDVNIVCESGDCTVGLIGNIEDYDLDIAVDAGDLKINGEKQANKYKSISEKEKSIEIQNEYGDVEIDIE